MVFVDADTELTPGWLAPLLAHMGDARVGLVAPRVEPTPGHGDRLARFEAWRSPLDLGPAPARVRAGSRVSYVPAAAVARAGGGLSGGRRVRPRASLRRGRRSGLAARRGGLALPVRAGVRRDPRTRPELRAWVRQRYEYGTSAAPLAGRHPGALAPVRVSGWSALAWGVGHAGVAARRHRHRCGHDRSPWSASSGRWSIRSPRRPGSAGLGNLFAGRILAAALTRAWWPIALVAALCHAAPAGSSSWPRVLPTLFEWATRPTGARPGLGARSPHARRRGLRRRRVGRHGRATARSIRSAPISRNWPGNSGRRSEPTGASSIRS